MIFGKNVNLCLPGTGEQTPCTAESESVSRFFE